LKTNIDHTQILLQTMILYRWLEPKRPRTDLCKIFQRHSGSADIRTKSIVSGGNFCVKDFMSTKNEYDLVGKAGG